MRHWVNVVALALVLWALFVLAGLYALGQPIVEFAHPSGTCVRVIPETAGTCDSLPATYDRAVVPEGIR